VKRTLLVALLAVPAAALAQAPPPTLPSRDVSIVYRAEGSAREVIPGGIPETLQVDWSARRQALRLQPQGRNQIMLLDLAATALTVIDTGLHSAMDLPVRAKDLDPVKLRDARLTRTGSEVIAGLACTDYAVQSRRGAGTVCLTGDGVALRAEGEIDGRQGSFTAVSVVYERLPPALFEVPPGYSSFSIPSFSMPGLMRVR